jgi:hypothetical protein
MFIPDPEFYPSQIENYFLFEKNAEEKNFGQFSKNYRFFYPKICHEPLQNMGLGSRSRGQKGTGSRIPDPQHC